jgi:hypothetical protein
LTAHVRFHSRLTQLLDVAHARRAVADAARLLPDGRWRLDVDGRVVLGERGANVYDVCGHGVCGRGRWVFEV